MAREQNDVFEKFRERLAELEKHVEDHDVANADPSEIPEFEAKFFSLARDLLMHVFELAKGFTYEEAVGLVESSDRSAPLRAQGTRIAKLLGSLEYAPDRSYKEIDDHLVQLGELIDLAEQEPRIKRIEAQGPSLISRIGHGFARATSILWFPFRWMYLSMRRKGHERKVEHNETYQVDELLEKGSSQLEKDRLEDAIRTYEKLSSVYDRLPASLKVRVRKRIIGFHSSILEKYESLRKRQASA